MQTMNFIKKWSIGGFLGLALIYGCAPQKIDPQAYPVTDQDLEAVEFLPTEKELNPAKQQVILMLVPAEIQLADTQISQINQAFEKAFSTYSIFEVISSDKVLEAANQQFGADFDPQNTSQLTTLVQSLGAQFAISYAPKKSVALFATEEDALLSLNVLTTQSSIVATEDLAFDGDADKKAERFRQFVQINFSYTGYISESRGDHSIVKISFGKNKGLEVGNTVSFFQTTKNAKLFGTEATKNSVMVETQRSFSKESAATGEVAIVNEKDAWVLVKTGQPNIRIGLAALVMPD